MVWAAAALCGLRAWLGILFLAHGGQKLGLGGGHGAAEWRTTVARFGFRPARLFAALSAAGELAGGACLVLGLGTPLVAAWLAVTMAVAVIGVHLRRGFWNQAQGYEYPLSLLIALLAVGVGGPGALSVDGLLWGYGSPARAVFAVVLGLGLIVGLGGLWLGRRQGNKEEVSHG
jgi:putative oxidoreductase